MLQCIYKEREQDKKLKGWNLEMENTRVILKQVEGETAFDNKVTAIIENSNGTVYEQDFRSNKEAEEWIKEEEAHKGSITTIDNNLVFIHRESNQFLEVNHEEETITTGLIENDDRFGNDAYITEITRIETLVDLITLYMDSEGYSHYDK